MPVNVRELRAQPTFPAFFTKTIKNFQMGESKDFDRTFGKIDPMKINAHMRAE